MTGVAAYVIADGSRLVAADEASEETIRGLPRGRTVEVTIVRRRSIEQLKFYYLFCHRVALMLRAMGAEHETKDSVDAKLRIATGHCELVPLSARLRALTGQHYGVTPGRIAFHKLSQDEFNAFVNRALAFVATELLPHVPTHELRGLVEELFAVGEPA